ncbi:hypothetical protein PF005_g12942 [Phytophthora fragariae]|uniref:Uncharacterized protein n=1 Tax=Phytophthora fragariae TaxID=53985 RepID=A0A6A3Y0S9_9STRA|nr:hypothetical protein PF003_g15683 [Phytophthora fragariae]KAE8935922.1 hypothetical protein PF009_g14141 [Phytophthora fragariae]KAE8988586.1 hypothetical protein PF011_g19111 [Phytophthora fragariae]KAE9106624.1 hypothetical protein PF010_g12558 [Phytophthora fragariae]KAE9206600.1 hypothetical protein PF005_g12942 [Phytophthora fragariae]
MLAGLIGDKPATGRNTTIVAPTVEITQRLRRKILRKGGDVDAVWVLSINHWELERRQTCMNQKRNERGRTMVMDRLKAERMEAAIARKVAKTIKDAEVATTRKDKQ